MQYFNFILLVINLGLFGNLPVMAADINLQVGESIIVQPNVSTRVTCGGANLNCGQAVSNFGKILQTCAQTYSAGQCVDKNWPIFKRNYSSCVLDAVDICLNYCTQEYDGGRCSSTCQ